MVLEANKQFHAVNKCIVAYINNTSILSEEQKKALVDDWKKTTGSKLKTTMNKSKTKIPKRVISKYIYFCQDERPRILKENKDMNINECTRIMGRLWREFEANPDPDRMERYTKLFEADQMRYEKEKRDIQNESVAIQIVSEEKPKKKCESAYLNYCAKRRETEPKISMKVLSIGWNLVKTNPEEFALYAPKS
jgi:HMG (high mobility group) box